ncbi:MAG: hypothetical protein HWN66_12045 [Candidatus Helarchaeota archaeon]|nr:hypothetical protein [Candidatus Helarchaeota archaeon]
MTVSEGILRILQHDLHKIRVPGALAHKVAMPNEKAREADGVAAWLSRNFLRESFQEELYRKSLIFPMRNLKNPRALINQHKSEVTELFKEKDAFKLHEAILTSKLLNLFSESKYFPYTSLKYHTLLTCALYFNLNQNHKLNELYLCENIPITSPFQIIYHDKSRTWAILPHNKEGSLTRIFARFYSSWERRRELIFGGDYRILAGILSSISSWSTALAVIEDFHELVDLC